MCEEGEVTWPSLFETDSSSSVFYGPFREGFASIPRKRSSSGFVGLLNQGATCYLNSLLQALYMTPEFKDTILSINGEEIGYNENEIQDLTEKKENEIEQKTKKNVVDISKLNELIGMGFDPHISRKALLLCEGDVVSAIDHILSGMIEASPPREEDNVDIPIEQESTDDKNEKVEDFPQNSSKHSTLKRKIIIELQRLFCFLLWSQREAVSTKQLTTSFGWKSRDTGIQHDVHELNRVLFDAIDKSLKDTSVSNLMKDLYRGKFVNKIRCLECSNTSEREEEFYDIGLIVGGKRSILESLKSLVQKEKMEKSDQYFCELCQKKVDAERWVTVRESPPILMLSLLRFEYDLKLNRRTKNTARCHFPLKLNMYPYLEHPNSDTDVLDNQICAILEGVGSFPNNNPESNITAEGCGDHAKNDVSKGISDWSLDDPVETATNGNNVRKIEYELFGVIVHDGSTGDCGHYRAFIRNNTASSATATNIAATTITSDDHSNDSDKIEAVMWLEFNDSRVSLIPQSKMENYFGGTECGYMLIYRQCNSSKLQVCLAESKNWETISEHCSTQFKKEVEQDNLALDAEIHKIELEQRSVKLNITLPQHYCVNKSGLAIKQDQSLTHRVCTAKTMLIDRNLTVSEMKKEILAQFSKDDDNDPFEGIQIEDLQLLPVNFESGCLVATSLNPADEFSNNVTVESLNLKAEQALLLWDGQHLEQNNKVWDWTIKRLSLEIRLLECEEGDSDPTCIESTVILSSSTSIHEFQSMLEKKFEIPISNQKVSIISNVHTVGEAKITVLDLANNKSLVIASIPGIDSDSVICLEEVSQNNNPHTDTVGPTPLAMVCENPKSEAPLAMSYYERLNRLIELFIMDGTLPHATSSISSMPSARLLLDRDMTLLELKGKALVKLDIKLNRDQTRLRHAQIGRYSGAILCNEELSVAKAGLVEGHRLVLEAGESPNPQMIAVKFFYNHQNEDNKSKYETLCNKSWSCLEMKNHMASMLNIDPAQHPCRLRRCDMWDNPTMLIEEENASIASLGLNNGDLICFEDGKLPKAGELALTCKLYVPVTALPHEETHHTHQLASPPKNSSGNSTYVTSNGTEQSSSDDAAQGSAANLFVEDGGVTNAPVVAEPEENLHHTADRSDQNEQILFSPALCTSRPIPPQYKLLDLPPVNLQDSSTLLELKEILLKYILAIIPIVLNCPFQTVLTPRHIRIWSKHRLLKGNDKRLSQLYLSSNSLLTVQLLEKEEIFDKPDEQTLIFVHKRDVGHSTFLPAADVYFNNKTRNEVGIAQHLSIALDIPMPSLLAAKFEIFSASWTILIDEMHETMEKQLGSKCVKSRKRKNAPLKDGDIIAVQDLRNDPSGLDLFHQTLKILCEKQERANTQSRECSITLGETRMGNNNNAQTKNHHKKKPLEAVLKIDLGF